MRQCARRGHCYFLSSRVHGGAIAKARQEFSKILDDAGSKYDPFRMGILMSAYVSETDEQARVESHEGIWYFLKNCLKGHLRNFQGRSLTFGPGVPNVDPADYRRMLENTKPGRAMLGDVDDWDALTKAQSILVGSPDTVYRQIIDLVRETEVGNLLIQFHMGNMRDDLARKSMRLFATKVAPRLRDESRVVFAPHFQELAEPA
jgi:alkanesulfonate monooxygenase SsuD/methylene tetrahydromethanopterin reductase-like flavin-dependent oxidoreductase (luciferase family)